jgi:hypothetical protein
MKDRNQTMKDGWKQNANGIHLQIADHGILICDPEPVL